VLALYLFGGEVLRGFAFTMIVGIISGTYSTVFIASSIAIILSRRKSGKVAAAAAPGSVAVSASAPSPAREVEAEENARRVLTRGSPRCGAARSPSGLTEFLPISSTAASADCGRLIGFQDPGERSRDDSARIDPRRDVAVSQPHHRGAHRLPSDPARGDLP
jgi:hypothetical protein